MFMCAYVYIIGNGQWPPIICGASCHEFFGLHPVLVRLDQKVLPVLVLGQKALCFFCPTHPVLVRPGLAVVVTGYPRVICLQAH